MFVDILNRCLLSHKKNNLHMLSAIFSHCDHEAEPSVNYSDLCASVCFTDANKIGSNMMNGSFGLHIVCQVAAKAST